MTATRAIGWILLTALFVLPTRAPSQTEADIPEDLKRTYGAFASAMVEGEAEKAIEFYAENAVVRIDSERAYRGRSTILEEFLRSYLDASSKASAGTEIEVDRVAADDDVVTLAGRYANASGASGIYANTWQRQADGTWKLASSVMTFEGSSRVGSVDRGHLERFLDGLVSYAMEEHHLPGVVVSVVSGDNLLLTKGWGRARLQPDEPVDPERTLFHVASISKTFTSTGVMQQVEAGRLRLDEDISTYLESVEIADTDRYGPLTMTHLMTHTGGFEATNIGHSKAASIDGDYSLAEYVDRYQPARVRSPGELASYSNYGVSLAGKVLEDVSGEDFADYMDRRVLEPLDMNRSSFRDWPGKPAEGYLNQSLAEDRAVAYRWSNGRHRPYHRFFMHGGSQPAASLSTTATDMARFMQAHLNGGTLDGNSILDAETAARMHQVLFRNAEGIMGNAHGFWSTEMAGYRTLEHSGYVLGFYSNMVLLPELDLGLFVATNGDDGRELITRLPRKVVKALFPDRSNLPEPDPRLVDRSEIYEGNYLATRRGYTTLDKILAMMSGIASVSVADSGHLIVSGLGEARRYVPAGNHRFVDVAGGRSIAFEVADGEATRFLLPAQAYERIGFWQTARAFYLVIVVGSVVLIGVLVGFWRRRRQHIDQNRPERWSARLLGITAVFWLVAMGTLLYRMANRGGPEPTGMVHFPDPLAAVALWGTLLSAVLTGLCVLGLAPVWHRRSWGIGRVLRHTAVVAVMVAITLMLWQWNAIGVQITGG